MDAKTVRNSQGTFFYTRKTVSNAFLCERCNKNKKSKIIVKWKDNEGISKVICNGCYGLLLSKN